MDHRLPSTRGTRKCAPYASIALYASWNKAKKSVALQMFAKGGHGFGMKKQGLPSDQWIERFHDWAVAENLTTSTITN